MKRHVCKVETCLCPIHETPMYYSIGMDEHACQNSDCKFAKGYEEVLWQERLHFNGSPKS
jgi:hypothetical protein